MDPTYDFPDNGVDYDPEPFGGPLSSPPPPPPRQEKPYRRPTPSPQPSLRQPTTQQRSQTFHQPQPGQKQPQQPSAPPRKKMKVRRVATPFRERPFVKFVTDSRTWAVCGVLLLCLAAYLVVASISYIRTGIADQSAVASLSVEQMVNQGVKIENAGGPAGARVAEWLFAGGLGLGSLALIVWLSLIGLALMGVRKCSFWSMTFKTLLVAISTSLVLGFIGLWFGFEISLGGMHGQYINQWLVERIDWTGTALVSVCLIACVVAVYLTDLTRLWLSYRAMRRAARARREQEELEREQDRLRAEQETAKNDSEASPETSFGTAASPQPEEEDKASDTIPVKEDIGFGEVPDDDPYKIVPGTGAENHKRTAPPAPTTENSEEFSAAEKKEEKEEIPGKDDQTKTNSTSQSLLPVPTPQASETPAVVVTGAEKTEAISSPGFQVHSTHIAEADPADVAEQPLYDPTAELSLYVPPTIELLNVPKQKPSTVDVSEQEENKERIIKTLNDYGIPISHIEATVGPTVTLYEIIPAEGVRIAKIKRLEDDIAMSLAALGIRIIAPIPGKGTIGIEVPNKDPQTVSIRSILGSKAFQETRMKLPMAMGATISNDVYIADLTKMPHLLVAGATGMGKSVGLNTIIASLLFKRHPAELKFVLVDPKMVEFSLYSVLEKHFLAKLPDDDEAVVTDMDKVVRTLNSLCVEMDQRYLLLKDANVRSITEYNEKFAKHILNPEKGHRYLPYIVMIVDEFADLIMTAGKQVEMPIARIAQKARAVGMHMIVATQRPSTNVITGIIKANFPGRIAFRVSQMVDSKTILDRTGANQLIGRGDMLFSHNGSMDRVQCAFIDTPEVEAICQHIGSQPGYATAYLLPEPLNDEADGGNLAADGPRDPLFEEAAQIIVASGVASTSNLQRRYSIGYNRAGKIMDQLEAAGVVGPAMGSKPRQVLIDAIGLDRILNN